MSARRYRFTLIVCLVLLAVGLMPLIRFWPHLHWRYANAEIALGVEPIPSKPLSAEPPAEELALCRIGPISIELPKAMSVNHEFKEGMGGRYIQFQDGHRIAAIHLPSRETLYLQNQLNEFPDKAKYTFPRLHKEMLDASSNNFSYAMSRKELRWHKWLLAYRSVGSDTLFDSVEYHWRADLESLMTEMSDDGKSRVDFEWATTDNRWNGEAVFVDTTPGGKWLRHACATFKVVDDPQRYLKMDEASLEESISVSEID